MKRVTVIFAAILVCFGNAYGQAGSNGAISGTVIDSQGASVPQATVTITNQATNVPRTVTTNDAGFYSAEALLAGTYSITVEKTGFEKSVTHDFALAPGQRLEHSVTLQTGNVQTEITVEAAAVQVQTESGASAGVIDAKQVSNLMLNGRNFQQLGMLVPGVNNTVGSNEQSNGGLTGNTTLVVNGLGVDASTYTIDGTYNMNTGNMTNINILPPIDIIAEFQVAKNAYSARYGMAGGGQIIVDTKSGTNEYHGTLWEFLRNNAFDARNFFSPTTSPLHQNIFGFELGGPLSIPKIYNAKKHRTFFLASEEFRDIHTGLVHTGAFFTSAMRSGNFSASPTLAGGGLKLDAAGQALLAKEGRTNCILSPTQLNPACFDPNSVALMNAFMPLPNNPAGGFNNYINPTNVELFTQRDDVYRVDQYIGQKIAVMARVMYENAYDKQPDLSGWGPTGGTGNVSPQTTATAGTTGLNALVRLTATIKPNIVNTTSLVETFDKPRILATGDSIPAGVSITQAYPSADPFNRPPQVAITGGWDGLGTATLPVYASDGEGTVSDDLSIVKGKHVIQAGGLYIFGIKRQNAFSSTNGVFTFNGVHTGDPAADFLLGLDSSYSQQNLERRYYDHYRQFEPYVQDDWKVSRNLTLNLGLRYYYFSSDTVQDAVTDFYANTYNPSQAPAVLPNGNLATNSAGQAITATGSPANVLNGLVVAGKNGVPPGFFVSRKTLFAPRFGFAWDINGDGVTAIRGGFGMGYSRTPFDIANGSGDALTNPPFQQTTTILNSSLTSPLAGGVTPLTASPIYLVPSNFQPDEIESWNLTFERQLMPGAVWNIAYVGSAAHHLKVSQDINFPLPVSRPYSTSCLSPGEGIPAGGFDFDPCLNTNLISSSYSPEVPFSGYSSIAGNITNGDSNYHSLQTGFTLRKGSTTVSAAYTYGKVLTDAAGHGYVGYGGGSATIGGGSVQNPRDLAADYGPAPFDRRHIFTGSWVYQLPFLKHSNGIVSSVLGSWSLSGIVVLESGFEFTPGVSTSTAGPSAAPRPNVVGTLTYPHTVNEWFNTGAFAAPPNGFFGNAGPGTIIGPNEKSVNLALMKNFPIKERVNFQFRAEAFNVFNHTNFGQVQTSVGAGNYGAVFTALDPRIMELALKMSF